MDRPAEETPSARGHDDRNFQNGKERERKWRKEKENSKQLRASDTVICSLVEITGRRGQEKY